MDGWFTCRYIHHNAFVERFIFLPKDFLNFTKITFLCNYDLSTLSTEYLIVMQMNFVWSFHFGCHNIATIKTEMWSWKYKEKEGRFSFRKHMTLDPISHRDLTNCAQTMEMDVNNLVHPDVKRINTQVEDSHFDIYRILSASSNWAPVSLQGSWDFWYLGFLCSSSSWGQISVNCLFLYYPVQWGEWVLHLSSVQRLLWLTQFCPMICAVFVPSLM
jgi:hypothetical protein